MSKEKKIAKKEAKAAKKAAKVEKSQAKQYESLVKSIEKKNAKAEKKAAKKGKPFVPAPIPTQEEAFAANTESTGKKIVKMIILLLCIWILVYFLVMWFTYVAPIKDAADEPGIAQEYDRYENQHEITTTPDYTVAEAKALLQQVLHDNWKVLGYSSDPSSSSINYTSNIVTVNDSDCYVFSASGKTFAVSVKLNAVYQSVNGSYEPFTFHKTSYLGFES